MCPVNPWLPLTVREVPPNEEPLDANREPLIELLLDAFDPKCEPEVEEPPKCEPSMFDTPRLGEIELRVDDDEPSIELRPAAAAPPLKFPVCAWQKETPVTCPPPPPAAPPLKFPACEFDATEGEFDPRDAPAAPEAPEL